METNFSRSDSCFSLCGLNCGLCPMQIRGDCGGCFTESPCYPACPIATCSVRHGNVEYCFACPEYPCVRYDGIDLHDSLISHRNQKKDLLKAKNMGIEAYREEQRIKRNMLDRFLRDYDDGQRDVFFCLAANLLEVTDLSSVLEEAGHLDAGMSKREKAAFVVQKLYDCAAQRGVTLKLRSHY